MNVAVLIEVRYTWWIRFVPKFCISRYIFNRIYVRKWHHVALVEIVKCSTFPSDIYYRSVIYEWIKELWIPCIFLNEGGFFCSGKYGVDSFDLGKYRLDLGWILLHQENIRVDSKWILLFWSRQFKTTLTKCIQHLHLQYITLVELK